MGAENLIFYYLLFQSTSKRSMQENEPGVLAQVSHAQEGARKVSQV